MNAFYKQIHKLMRITDNTKESLDLSSDIEFLSAEHKVI